MTLSPPLPASRAALLTVLTTLLLAGAQPTARAQESATLSVLHNFTDEGSPFTAGVVQGDDGNFYGTTQGNGANAGTIFRCTPTGELTILYAFSGVDGNGPLGLVKGRDGNFYGVTHQGGHNYDAGEGVIFQITPAGAYTNLHTFSGNGDGGLPVAGLVQGADGNFYGTTTAGGPVQATDGEYYGTIFQLTPAGDLTTLYGFTGMNDAYPDGALVQGTDGSFYGTTNGDSNGGGDGDNNHGEVFRLDPTGTFTPLHIFSGSDGDSPRGALVQGTDGNFYGTTVAGGPGGADASYGTAFRVSPTGDFTSLHSFIFSEGIQPNGALVQGADGNFYGTTYQGGTAASGRYQSAQQGTAFQMTPAGVVTVILKFGSGSNGNAVQPEAGLLLGSDGNLYGTTILGGTNNDGTIFKLTVTAVPSAFFTDEAALANGVYYLAFPNGNPFGYYSYLSDPHYIYHFDLGYEYVFDAADGHNGVYFYDFASNDFVYTSPGFPFPYLYDFGLNSVVYYYPDPNNAGHYNTDGVRYFYVFSTGQIISK